MKLVVVTYGTEGDTRPLAALCRALQDAGHRASPGRHRRPVLLGRPSATGQRRAGPVPAKDLRSDRLAPAVREADGSALRDGAASLGASIAREDRLRTAVAAIERLATAD